MRRLGFSGVQQKRQQIDVMTKNGFCEMVGEFAAAKSSGSAGTQPETHTTDAAPLPVLLWEKVL